MPESLEGCHTAIVGGYVVEGLVPATFIKRLLSEHLAIKGITHAWHAHGGTRGAGRTFGAAECLLSAARADVQGFCDLLSVARIGS